MGDETREMASGEARARALTTAEIAWTALLPCAIAAVAAIVLLGPPLGHLLFPAPGAEGLWPPGWSESQGRPEPVEQARYILAVLAAALLAAAILASSRRTPALRPRTIRAAVLASQLALLALVVVGFLGQYEVILRRRPMTHIFRPETLLIAVALVVAALGVLRRRTAAQRIARLLRETAPRRTLALVLAFAVAATWLLQGIYTDRWAEDAQHLDWTLNEAFAVLDGRTPLVDAHVLYAKLLPYPAALAMTAFGRTAFVYTLLMVVLSVLALVGVFAILRRIAGSSLLALGLFVPFVALGSVENTYLLTAMWPMRYGGAYLMAWLTARHIDRRSPRHAWILFLAGGIVAVNDLEFGVAAVVATAVTLLFARPPHSARAAGRLAGHAIGGTLAAVFAISALTLLRSGALPDPAVLLEWPRIFSRLGWFSLPMPPASLHLALYAIFVAALATAVVRQVQSAEDPLLTGMLAWSGTFGLLAGGYYVGRSDELKLVCMFSAAAFSLALLTIVAGRALAARGWRRPALSQLLVLFGFALAVCSIVQLPSPQHELARLTEDWRAPVARPAAELFIGEHTRRREKVVILVPMNYRIAYDLGLTNVSPYGTEEDLVTRWQIQTVVDMARREGAHKIFLKAGRVAPAQLRLFRADGFALRTVGAEPLELGFLDFIELADA
jgi:hypothetical protein